MLRTKKVPAPTERAAEATDSTPDLFATMTTLMGEMEKMYDRMDGIQEELPKIRSSDMTGV